MLGKPSQAGASAPSNESQDARDQRIVLTRVLALHPSSLSFHELAAEICDDPDDFSEGDALARAVRDLAASGLLRSNGLLVMPTEAAVSFDRLRLS